MRYIDLLWIVGASVCIFCSHREIASIQLDDSPTILIAGSIVVTACAIYNRSSKTEVSENDDSEDSEPIERDSVSTGQDKFKLKNGRIERKRVQGRQGNSRRSCENEEKN